ncbi:response regulator [Phenylobacterium sp. J426]|uniref:response regulator n=1 Tax=Phenylobacterium sp. J426 TaxID=2898439 RepID=UPI002150BCD5|nr:response regulator [Phenylobacterium sp. J426]MCR5873457.1 response regulator [Phenylobacterium sp. J426]
MELALETLQSLGYAVTAAGNAQEALEAFESANVVRPIDLLFSDIIMPGAMNGIALAAELRARAPDLKVLLATGYNEELVDAPHRPDLDVLSKPYRQSELADRIRQALNAQGGGDRRPPSDPPYIQA